MDHFELRFICVAVPLIFLTLLVTLHFQSLQYINAIIIKDVQASNSMAQPSTYSPKILNVIRYPANPTTNSEVRIYASVIDKYADIKNATLSYSRDHANYNNVTMKLINGTYSNGTYLGIISPGITNKENATIKYKFFFKDNLGYFYNSDYEEYKLLHEDKISPEIFSDEVMVCPPDLTYSINLFDDCLKLDETMPRPTTPLLFSVDIFDNGTGIKNATLYYSTDIRPPYNYSTRILAIVPSIGSPNVYLAIGTLPRMESDSNLRYYIQSYDYAGNKNNRTFVHFIPFIPHSKPTSKANYYFNSNKTSVELQVLQISNNSLNAQIKIALEAEESTQFRSYNFLFDKRPPFEVLNIDDNFTNLANIFEGKTLLNSRDNSGGISTVFFIGEQTTSSLKLFGNPSAYPFDHYYLNLLIGIPLKKANISEVGISDTFKSNTISFGERVNQTWVGHGSVSSISNDDPRVGSLCGSVVVGRESLCANTSFLNVKVGFDRNYTIAAIIIPLIALFYLLGSIFVFESSSDSIGNRLVLALSIFALIFTLPGVINSLKPQTSGPTIADSMLSIIIIATIAFTVSSVLSSSRIIRTWFPKRYAWIDGIVFIIISGIVIAYFSNFPFAITIWLIPIILLGLGYGLLLRLLGFKINRPLKDVLQKHKE